MKFSSKLKPFCNKHKKTISAVIVISLIVIPVMSLLVPAMVHYYNDESDKDEDLDIDSLLWRFGRGLPGTGATMQPRKVDFGGGAVIIVGTDGGIASITLDGLIDMSYMTFGDVITFELINDISGDGLKDIVLVVYDRQHANVIAIASNDGHEIWKYDPRIEGYDPVTFAVREFITYTWDVEVIEDIDDEGGEDVVISSWNRIIALEGDEGEEIWINDDACTNDIWNIEVLDDKIIAGSEAGEVVAVNKEDGKLEWTSEVHPTTDVLLWSLSGQEFEIDSSINDILIIGDDILVSTDNGFLYTISGDDGKENDNYEIYEIPDYDEVIGEKATTPTSPYSCERRLFQRAGLELYETIDTNGDGINEYIAIAYHLEYTEGSFHDLDDVNFEGILFNCDGDEIDVIVSGDFNYDDLLYTASYPQFVNVDGNINGYFFRNNFEGASSSSQNYQGIYSNDYYTNKLVSARSSLVVRTGSDSETEADDSDTIGKYLLNVGDVNGDSVDDLFAIGDDGKYMLIDLKNSQTIWSRSKAIGGTELTQIKDIDGDNIQDFLFKRTGDFEPTWRDHEGEEIEVPGWSTYRIAEGDPAEDQEITVEFLVISARTGKVIWEFSVPNPDYYEGLRDIINIGDVDGDNIDDYAGWIIPTDYPEELEDYIFDLTGKSTISINSYDDRRNNYVEDAINMALLTKYTKFLVIKGSNGLILWNTSLVDFPYKYYRDFGYDDSYDNPKNLYSNQGSIYHRTYGEIDSSWYDGNDRDHILWESEWNSSSLTHAMNVEVESGTKRAADSLFDLFGDSGNNHNVTTSNSSALILIGDSSSSSSDTDEIDNSFWQVDSEYSSGMNKIILEMSFNQSLDIKNDFESVFVDYTGNLTEQVDQISVFIYDFTSAQWTKISPNSINSTTIKTMSERLVSTNDYVNLAKDNLVKIRVAANHSSSFSLNIDELIVNYEYKLGNYTIKSEKVGSLWQTSINFTFPLEFGTDYHALSQIDRISALKMQSRVSVNHTDELQLFNFTYEVKSGGKWSLLRWDPKNRTVSWNDSWHGGFKNTSRSGYRDEYNGFNFADEFRDDHMYIIERGTYNPEGIFGVDDGVEFDYENKSMFSGIIDPNNNILFRINVTHTNKPFNLTIDSFGLGVFYWGVFGNDYDPYYVYDLENDKWDVELKNVLNLKIQDFKVINGTDDNFLDVLVVIGFESYGGGTTWTSRLSLFDAENQSVSTQWGYNCRDILPYNIISVTYLNRSRNGWILSGTFDDPSTQFSHRFIGDPNFDNAITNYENYSDPTITYQSKSIDITDKWSGFYEIPGTTSIGGSHLGLILGDYVTDDNQHQKIKIINSKTLVPTCYISLIGLEELGMYNKWVTMNDFSSTGAGYKIKFSYADFNGDGYPDHVASSDNGKIIKIFSGSSDSDGNAIVEINLEEIIIDGDIGEKYHDYGQSDNAETTFTIPFASVGDINGDNVADGVVGTQIIKEEWGDDLYSAGAALQFYDIRSSLGTGLEEIDINDDDDDDDDDDEKDDDKDDDENDRGFSSSAWELESYGYVEDFDWSEDCFEYFDYIENIGDFNGDGHDEIICGHDIYEYSDEKYINSYITDLIDVYNQKLIYRINLDTVDTIYPISDYTGDGKNEFIISSGESFFCINSEFAVEFENLEDDDEMSSNNFLIDWETEADYDYFELIIDGSTYCITNITESYVSLGPGEKKVQIFMYDKSGIIVAVDEVTITVSADYSMWILTLIMFGAISILAIAYKRIKKRKGEVVLIDKEKTKKGL